ncbi:MAG: hypothetical protein ABJA76_10255 [Mucilaginibacter sp.]
MDRQIYNIHTIIGVRRFGRTVPGNGPYQRAIPINRYGGEKKID